MSRGRTGRRPCRRCARSTAEPGCRRHRPSCLPRQRCSAGGLSGGGRDDHRVGFGAHHQDGLHPEQFGHPLELRGEGGESVGGVGAMGFGGHESMMHVSVARCKIEHMFDTMDEAALIDRIAVLERAKSAAAAEQAVLTAQLDTTRRAAEAAAGVPAAKRGRGLASEIALARRDPRPAAGVTSASPGPGARDAPHPGRPRIRGALGMAGHPDRARKRVPRRRGPRPSGRRTVRRPRHAGGQGRCPHRRRRQGHRLRLDPHAVVDRAARAETERSVYRPPGPGLHDLCDRAAADDPGRRRSTPPSNGPPTPASTAAAAARSWPTPSSNASPADPPRSRSPIAVNLVISDDTLFGGGPTPARVPGYGPIPAAMARQLVADAADRRPHPKPPCAGCTDTPPPGRWSRWNRAPGASPRAWPRFIAAPRRHLPHPVLRRPHPPHRPRRRPRPRRSHDRGQRAGHLRGLQLRQRSPRLAGRHHRDRDGTHTCELTTPTGARHQSTAPPLPGRPGTRRSIVEVAFADDLAWHNAA